MNQTDPLSGLRDIHVPAEPHWWPPAIGWWLVALLVLAAIAGLIFVLYRRWRRGTVPRAAKRMLDEIEQHYLESGDDRALVRSLSMLLRRVVVINETAASAAGYTGREWLECLDRLNGNRDYSEGPGRVMADAPYRPQANVDGNQLIALVRFTLEQPGWRQGG